MTSRNKSSSLKHPTNADKGGLETRPSQPLKRAPLRETYGARSGEKPEKEGTSETIKTAKCPRNQG